MNKIIMAAAIGVSTLGSVSVASAALCSNVDIRIHNDFELGTQIKVVDFDYWDATEGKWREENFVANEIINHGSYYTITNRDLEYVGNEYGVKIRVQYRYLTANNGWSDELNATSATFHCDDNDFVHVYVTEIN